MTEHELIRLLHEGDESAFRELVMQYQDRIYNTAFGLLQHESDAEDIAQEVFIQVHRSIGKFRGNSLLSTWIYRITVSKSLDLLRSRRRKKRFGLVSALFGNDNHPVFEPGDFHHPGVQQEKKEDAAILFRAVNQLPENQQTAFLLNKVEGLNYREIAAILKTTEAAVDSLLQRARQNLRRNLAGKINLSS